jgi:hypothetical protein
MEFVKATFLAFISLCIVALLSPVSRGGSEDEDTQKFRNGEIIVEIKPGSSIEDVNARNRTTTIERIYGTNYYRLRIPQDKGDKKWLKRVTRDKGVLSASLNPLVTSPVNVFARSTVGFPNGHATPGRSRMEYALQPELFELLNLRDSQLRSRGAGVVVAVIDTGVACAHPDLVSHLWNDDRVDGDVGANGADNDNDGFVDDFRGWDFIDNDNDPTESADDPGTTIAGHGTFIGGLIALIAPECRILPIRAFTPDGMSNAFTVAAAIKYATDHGAQVINLSFGSPKKSAVLRDAIRYAQQNGAVLVAAMGNENEDTDEVPQYPANLGGVMAVAAIDAESRKASFSNFGTSVCVDALGVKLTSTYPGDGGDYALWSGTSFAVPLTAAEAALIIAQEQREDARGRIENTAIKIDKLNPEFSGKLGKGRINPLGALEETFAEQTPAGNYASMYFASGSDEPRAKGFAGIAITESRQALRVAARSLDARGEYALFVDGKNVTPDKLTASSFGDLAVELSTDLKDSEQTTAYTVRLPSKFNPVTNIKHIELRAGDRVALQGDFGPIVGGAGPGGQLFEKEAPLSPTPSLPQAGGRAQIKVEEQREGLKVEGERLTPGALYTIFADGINVGSAVAQSGPTQLGFLRIELTNNGRGERAIPPLLRPVVGIKRVEVRDSSGQVILRGDFLPGGDDIGGGRP